MDTCGAEKYVLGADRVCEREPDHPGPHIDGDVMWWEFGPERKEAPRPP